MNVLRAATLIAVHAVVATLVAQSIYLLAGGEEECLRSLAVEEHPLTCWAAIHFATNGAVSLIASVLMVPVFLWLRSTRKIPLPVRRFAAILVSIGPLLLSTAVFATRVPHAGSSQAAWEAVELAVPLLLALAVVALALRIQSSRAGSSVRNNAA